MDQIEIQISTQNFETWTVAGNRRGIALVQVPSHSQMNSCSNGTHPSKSGLEFVDTLQQPSDAESDFMIRIRSIASIVGVGLWHWVISPPLISTSPSVSRDLSCRVSTDIRLGVLAVQARSHQDPRASLVTKIKRKIPICAKSGSRICTCTCT